MTDNTTFLGFDKKQIPLLALLATIVGTLIAFGGIIIALHLGTRSDMNANHAELRADINTLQSVTNANDNALRAEMTANDNALRSDINALRSDINALAIEMAETNARIENIERSLPQYAFVDERLDDLEREQARLADLERELARLNELVKTLTNNPE